MQSGRGGERKSFSGHEIHQADCAEWQLLELVLQGFLSSISTALSAKMCAIYDVFDMHHFPIPFMNQFRAKKSETSTEALGGNATSDLTPLVSCAEWKKKFLLFAELQPPFFSFSAFVVDWNFCSSSSCLGIGGRKKKTAIVVLSCGSRRDTFILYCLTFILYWSKQFWVFAFEILSRTKPTCKKQQQLCTIPFSV